MNQIPVKKNEKYIVDIIDNGFGGEEIARSIIEFIKENKISIYDVEKQSGAKRTHYSTYIVELER